MGQGGYLWIINATYKTLKVVDTSSYQMNSWKFSDIPSQSQKRFYIEYKEGIFKTKSDDAGKATFQLEGTSSSFQLLVCWPFNEGECGLKVDWSATKGDYQVFPPALEGESFGKLGWFHDGSLSLLIMETGTANSVFTHLPSEHSIVSASSTVGYPLTPLYGSWMEFFSGLLGKLTLAEMTIPGTHDSGTFRPVSVVGSPWIKTQALSLAGQLKYGIRTLDLRIGQNSPGHYILCHHTWRTSYSLAEALKEVTDFIDKTSKEIVILDFHRFVNFGNGSYDYYQLKQQIASDLSGYCLPASSVGDTLANIWSSHKKRVVVAWNTSNPDPYMWPGVNQRWYSDSHSLSSLYKCIKSDMLNPPEGLWAACSFMVCSPTSTPHSNAKKSNPTITNWYFGGSKFCEKANIISVDFFNQYSNVVQASIIGSLLKAGKK